MTLALRGFIATALVIAPALGAQSSAIVLQLPASARAAALGNSFSAVGRDDATIFYNPAQLALGEGRSAGASVQRYVAQSSVAALSAATRLGPGRVGIGLQFLDYGSDAEIIPDPNFGGERGRETGTRISASDLVASLGYGMSYHGSVRAGVTAKLVRQQLVDFSDATHAIDAGVAIDIAGGSVAAVMQNSGGLLTLGSSTTALPLMYRGAVAMPPLALGRVRLAETVELSHQRGGGTVPSAGAEVSFIAGTIELAGRVGFAARRDASSSSSRLTFGGGIAASHFALDYAYQMVEGLDIGTHRVGVRWRQ